jgi:DNA-binding transcriptional LysR family regulator
MVVVVLDMRRLQALQAVVESDSVKAAAERLGYTPSAVSQHVNALESSTGTRLLEPDGRGIRPTAAGLLLAQHATRLLDGLAEAQDELDALNTGQIGTLRVASFATAGAELLPPSLALSRAELPGLTIKVRVTERAEALDLLARAQLDVAVIEAHEVAAGTHEGLRYTPLLEDPFRIVVPRDHRLARKRRIDLRDTSNEPWLDLLCEVDCCRAVTNAAFRDAGVTPRRAVEAQEYWPAQGFVAAGLGLALIPALALGVLHPGVAVKRLQPADQPHRDVLAVTRASAGDSLPVATMLRALKTVAHNQARSPKNT